MILLIVPLSLVLKKTKIITSKQHDSLSFLCCSGTMKSRASAQTLVFLTQNTLAAIIFGLLLISNTLAYLLYSFPSAEILWRLNIAADRVSRPVTYFVDGLPGPSLAVSLVLLAASWTIAWFGYRRRNLLATAACGHVALIAGAYTTLSYMKVDTPVASLSFRIDPESLTLDAVSMATMLSVMLILCVTNHVLFIRRLRQS